MYKIKLEPGDYVILTGLNYDQTRNLYERFGGKIEDGLIPPEFFGGSCVRKTENGAEVFFGPSPIAPIAGNCLTYDQIMEKEAENDWFEKGEFPPVGADCELCDGGNWVPVKILTYALESGKTVCIFQLKNAWRWAFNPKFFRPIKSERERTIEAALALLPFMPIARCNLKKLYDAGMLKLPEQSK